MCQIKSLQKINFQFQYFLDLLRCFKSLCNDLHITFMCIRDNVFHNLLFIRIRINITDDRKIYFDILRCQIKKALLVVIQCKSTLKSWCIFLCFQCMIINRFFFCDLNNNLFLQLCITIIKFYLIFCCHMLTRNRIDKQKRIAFDSFLFPEISKGFCRPEHGHSFNFTQCTLFTCDLHNHIRSF